MTDWTCRWQTRALTECCTHPGACHLLRMSRSHGHWTRSKALAWSANRTAGWSLMRGSVSVLRSSA
eukprot:3645893-Prorocentrum_lima.AAC.1